MRASDNITVRVYHSRSIIHCHAIITRLITNTKTLDHQTCSTMDSNAAQLRVTSGNRNGSREKTVTSQQERDEATIARFGKKQQLRVRYCGSIVPGSAILRMKQIAKIHTSVFDRPHLRTDVDMGKLAVVSHVSSARYTPASPSSKPPRLTIYVAPSLSV